MCNTLIIDNFDSFTYNLFQYMGEVCGREPTVLLNTVDFDQINLDKFDCIIVSPGPGTPKCAADIGVSARIIREADIPVLGVCLGHQIMAYVHGMDVVHAPEPVHGRVSVIQHSNQGVFRGLPEDLSVVRYHSLVVAKVSEPFEVTAWDSTGMIHGIQHKSRPLYGVQFHPESICSEAGLDLLRNFRDIAIARRMSREPELQRAAV